MRRTLAERLDAMTQPEPNSGCWLFTGAWNKDGYGRIRRFPYGSKMAFAHRAAWECANGDIPPGMLVCHRCDVRACVNADHLFLGSNDENMRDMATKGRAATGERVHGAKLRASDVAAIRAAHAARDGWDAREQAATYGVAKATINRIVAGRIWRSADTKNGACVGVGR